MDVKSGLKWTDLIQIAQAEPYRADTATFDQIRSRLFSDPLSIVEKRFQFMIDFSQINSLFAQIYTIPQGCVLKYAGLLILSPIITGGTTSCLSLGDHSGTVTTYGKTSDLVPGSTCSSLFQYNPVGSETPLDLCACNGTNLGDTNLTGGLVLCSIAIDSPASLRLK